jgi:hypothetical protein
MGLYMRVRGCDAKPLGWCVCAWVVAGSVNMTLGVSHVKAQLIKRAMGEVYNRGVHVAVFWQFFGPVFENLGENHQKTTKNLT